MSSDETPTRRLMRMDPNPPAVPNRFREALLHVADDALDESVSATIGQWLYDHRGQLTRGGDEAGDVRFNYEVLNIEKHAPEILRPLRRKLLELAGDAEVLDKVCVPAFDLRNLEMHATLYHHGAHFGWHDDAVAADGRTIIESRRLAFCYYMHSEPKMFNGGALEFLDGTSVTPKNNRLVLFHPVQQHRVLAVECWSSHVLHGRWAIVGWLHGDPPAGYRERLPAMRGELG
jgi:hypothetical protein